MNLRDICEWADLSRTEPEKQLECGESFREPKRQLEECGESFAGNLRDSRAGGVWTELCREGSLRARQLKLGQPEA